MIPRSERTETKRVLPPDVYDALELSALAFGGVGKAAWTDHRGNPMCIVGHAVAVEGGPWSQLGSYGEVGAALRRVGITISVNDELHGGVIGERIPFEWWCKRLNVIRADEPTYDAEFVASLAPRAPRRSRRSHAAPSKRGKLNG